MCKLFLNVFMFDVENKVNFSIVKRVFSYA